MGPHDEYEPDAQELQEAFDGYPDDDELFWEDELDEMELEEGAEYA